MMNLTAKQLNFYKKILIATFLGISSGMPYFVFYQTLPALFRESGMQLSTIAAFGLVSIPYTLKFAWAPLVDRYTIPLFGHRRGWMFLMQILLIFIIAILGLFNPVSNIPIFVVLSFLMIFFSATQDIVIDAYRRELLDDDELGTGNAWFVNAWRFSTLIPGSLAFIMADIIAWKYVFPIISFFMLIGLFTTLFIHENSVPQKSTGNLSNAIIEPFKEYFNRFNIKHGLLLLIFLMLYKLGDSMATALSTPFYLDIGFSKTVLGTVAKVAALWSSIAGAFIAGMIMRKISLNKSLWLFGFFQLFTILGFAWLASINAPTKTDLFIVISLEYLGVGMGTVAIISFMFKMSSKAFAASQIALFTAVTAIPRTFINATTGYIIENVGYTDFFLICTACAIPGMLLLLFIAPWKE
jgi:PAT family beta-lactamase induction signal transducer AmpG